MNGTLTEEEFKKQCKALVSLSDNINDGWELREDDDDIYIIKNVKVPVVFREENKNTNSASETDASQDGTESDDESSEDQITLQDSDPHSISPATHLIKFEYHVIYSCSYTVPVLYFNAWHSTGQLLSIEEIWKIAPPCSDRYSYITQIDHPILARPYYEVHPCRTEKLMELVEGAGGGRYLVSWLSSVGRDVGLSVDIRYAMSDGV